MTMRVQTRYAELAELALDAASAGHWLSPRELACWHEHQSPERRRTWLAGRIVAKQLILANLNQQTPADAVRPAAIDIDSRSAAGKQGDRPVIQVHGRALPWALSIAHSDRGVLVALATTNQIKLGVDLASHSADQGAALDWCLTPAEQRWRAAQVQHAGATAQLWVVKEALYKACQMGEGFAPRQIEMLPGGPARYPLPHRALAVERVQSWRVDGQWAALAVAAA